MTTSIGYFALAVVVLGTSLSGNSLGADDKAKDEANRVAPLERFVGELSDLRGEAAGRDGNVARANFETPGCVYD